MKTPWALPDISREWWRADPETFPEPLRLDYAVTFSVSQALRSQVSRTDLDPNFAYAYSGLGKALREKKATG